MTDSSIKTRTIFLANTQKGFSHCFTHHNITFDTRREAWGENTIIIIWGKHLWGLWQQTLDSYIYTCTCIYRNHTYIFIVSYLQTFYAYINIYLGMYLAERCKNVTSITAVKLTIFKTKHPETLENLFSLTNTFSFPLFSTSPSCKTQNHFVSW